MAKVLLEMSMSVDGCVTGPDVSPEEPMGRGGEQLHEWMFEGRSPAESEQYQIDHFRGIGAVIVDRRAADLGIAHWGVTSRRSTPPSSSSRTVRPGRS
jgi:hypothetical protein